MHLEGITQQPPLLANDMCSPLESSRGKAEYFVANEHVTGDGRTCDI